MRERALWGLVIVLCVALLCAPALWNGFPLLQYDTGGYLARWYEGYLVPSRAVTYGLILNAGQWWNFWPVVLVQSALTVWVTALMLRVHGSGRPLILLGVIVVLSFFTTLPWLTAILLTDIFCGLGVLGLYLLLMQDSALSRAERIGLVILVAIAGATHSATLAVLIAVAMGIALWRLVGGNRKTLTRLRDGFAALVLGALLVFATNYAASGWLAWTPGGLSLSFGRMLQDGIVNRYLDDHCPDAKLKLCPYRAELPRNADAWFWGNPTFIKLGRFAGLGDEMARIALDSMIQYPAMQAETAAKAFAQQIVNVRSGEGVNADIWHTYAIIKRYTPWAAPAMQSARQQAGAIEFRSINAVHYPLALLALIVLPLLMTMRGENWRRVRELAAMIAIAVLANAAVCGILSNPHDRYGARIVWLAGFAVAIAALQFAAERKAAAQLDPYTPPVR
jgi:hypothetical protein